MVQSSPAGLCSFADIDPFDYGLPSIPSHEPPPHLPEGVTAIAGRQAMQAVDCLAVPAFVEDLLIVHLHFPVRLSVKIRRWFHVHSEPGDLTLVPCGNTSSWSREGTMEALMLSLPPALMQKTALQDAECDPARFELVPRVGHADALVHAVGQAIVGELQTSGLLGALYLETLFRTLAIHLLRNHAVFVAAPAPVNGQLPGDAVHQVREYVHEHLNREITLETLAALVHLSPYHFARNFKKAMGLPPYQYVLQCRVKRAKELLIAGDHPISEVAQMVGFASQSHLTRHIKRAFGVTPGDLLPMRKNRQEQRKNVEEHAPLIG